MTCIVGLRTEDGVLLAGDSLGTNSDDRGLSFRAPKVFRLSREIAVGFMGSFRMGQLLEHHLDVPDLVGDELAWAIKKLVPAIRDVFKEHGLATIEHNEETGGTFLLAVRGRLFIVQEDFAVLEGRLPYAAIGSGENFALGAMFALENAWDGPPPARRFLKLALDASSIFANGVAPPYNFVTTRV